MYLRGRAAGSDESNDSEERDTENGGEGHTPTNEVGLPRVNVGIVTVRGILNQAENHDRSTVTSDDVKTMAKIDC